MLKQQLSDDLKSAMRAKAARSVSTLRLVLAAIKEHEISVRTEPDRDGVSDDEIILILAKMMKQRKESARIYEESGRDDLAEQEREEIEVIETYMPKQMTAKEIEAVCANIRDELSASGLKDMGRCMGVIKERYAGKLDVGLASRAMKSALT